MTIIKIKQNGNGSHDNQTINGVTPEALGTPETLENYPFGEITVEDRDGVPTVTSWTPLPIPEPEPQPEERYTAEDLLRALAGA